jgi:hypothetical protein
MFTNAQIAMMSTKGVAEQYGLTVQNAWCYQRNAKTACANGNEDGEFQPPKRRGESTASPKPNASPKSASPKAAANPLTVLDGKTAVVMQLIAVNHSVSANATALRAILEQGTSETSLLSAQQLQALMTWAGCKTLAERREEFISKTRNRVYEVDSLMSQSRRLAQAGFQITPPYPFLTMLDLYQSCQSNSDLELDFYTAAQIEQVERSALFAM